MNAARRIRRLLDPIGGDSPDHPDRKLRLNLRRVEQIAAFEICTMLYEGTFSFYRDVPVPGLLRFCVLHGVLSLAFLLVARHGQKQEARRLSRLPEVFLVYALLMVQAGGYLFAESGRLVTGYSFTYLVCAAFFLLPPRRFALIGLGTLAFYAGWISMLPFSVAVKTANLANTALIAAAAMLARWGLSRLEEVNERQRRQIAAQNAALAETNRRLTARIDELNSLMAIAAHDLRSPLHGLNNLLDLATAQPPTSSDAWQELLREANTSVASMLGLIGRILEAHEAETETPREFEYRDLRRAIDTAVRRARATATHAGVELFAEPSPHPVPATVDPDALDQILDNLLGNAIRFSPPGSTVRLAAGLDPSPFVEVADEGVGIARDQREHLFGKFRRGAVRPLNGPRGSGLGLYIVRTLATSMGATASHRPGDKGGSVFRVVFESNTPALMAGDNHFNDTP